MLFFFRIFFIVFFKSKIKTRLRVGREKRIVKGIRDILVCLTCFNMFSEKWKPLAEEKGVWMAMGCHPKSATDYSEEAELGLRIALRHKKTVALGEIGLDYSKQWVSCIHSWGCNDQHNAIFRLRGCSTRKLASVFLLNITVLTTQPFFNIQI